MCPSGTHLFASGQLPRQPLTVIHLRTVSCSPLLGVSFGQLYYQLETPRTPRNRLCGPGARTWGGIVRGGGVCFIIIHFVHPGAPSSRRGCPCAVAVELVCAARCLKPSIIIIIIIKLWHLKLEVFEKYRGILY